MSNERKPRGDAVLKTLPKERQAQIAEHGAQHTLAETQKWLAGDGIKISSGALSNFLSWHAWQESFRLCESDALNFMEMVKQKRPDVSEADLESFGNEFFQLQSIRLNNPELFLQFRQARAKADIEKQKLAIAERRVVLLEKKAAQADQTEAVLNEALSPEERERRIKEIYGRA